MSLNIAFNKVEYIRIQDAYINASPNIKKDALKVLADFLQVEADKLICQDNSTIDDIIKEMIKELKQ